MSFDAGIDFRATSTGPSGFSGDPTNCTYCLADAYPTARGGFTFGWSAGGVGTRDRSGSVDPRLAGINFMDTVGVFFRLDLPSTGAYDVHVAAGDDSSNNTAYWDLTDNGTVFKSLVPSNTGTVAGGSFDDASDTVRTAAAWPGSEVKVTHTFTSTIFKLVVRATGSDNVIAHVRLVAVAASGVYGWEDWESPALRRDLREGRFVIPR